MTAALMCEQYFAGIRNISTLIMEKVRMDIGAKSASASVKMDTAVGTSQILKFQTRMKGLPSTVSFLTRSTTSLCMHLAQ